MSNHFETGFTSFQHKPFNIKCPKTHELLVMIPNGNDSMSMKGWRSWSLEKQQAHSSICISLLGCLNTAWTIWYKHCQLLLCTLTALAKTGNSSRAPLLRSNIHVRSSAQVLLIAVKWSDCTRLVRLEIFSATGYSRSEMLSFSSDKK